MDKAALDRLIYWISERHNIYKRKKAGLPKPWSDDPVMRLVYFTNVFRELDKVTTWLREEVREPLRNDPSVLFAVICFRWFNWIPTGQLLWKTRLLKNWDSKLAIKVLTNEKNQGKQVFTGAFNISNSGSTKPKINRVVEDYIQPVWEQRNILLQEMLHPYGSHVRNRRTLERAHALLKMRCPGLGGSGFMAAQVIADLKHTDILENASDWWTWCSPGPGSIKGLNIVLGRPVEAPKPKNFLEEINKLQEIVAKRLPKLPRLCAQDMQSCLCEYSKSERVRNGGSSKRKYPGV